MLLAGTLCRCCRPRSAATVFNSGWTAWVRRSAGDLFLRGGYNHSNTDIVGTVATPPQLAAYSSVLFDRIERRRIECGQPQHSLRLGANCATRHVGLDINESRYGVFCSFTQNPSDDQQYAAKWLTDLEAS